MRGVIFMRKFVRGIACLLSMFFFLICNGTKVYASDFNDDYLHTDGNKIYDSNNNEVRITGISWFGMETPDYNLHGLWANNLENILNIAADSGFNTIRIPLSVELVNKWRNGEYPMGTSTNANVNGDLADKNSLQVLDAAISCCKSLGIKVMLDIHRVESGGQSNLYYTNKYTVEDYENCWEWLAAHYKNDDTVIAADLFNEPHGKAYYSEVSAKWDGSEDENNWRYEAIKVAKKILKINPNLLIVVEGIETTPKEGYTYESTKDPNNYYGTFWGGNLREVKNYPVDLGEFNNKVVYSPHDYGPSVSQQSWFQKDFNKETLINDTWEDNWLYIHDKNIAPLLIGEWGGIMDGGDNEKWMNALASLISERGLSHTFWCLNANSGDTGGILKYDFKTVDEQKLKLVQKTLWKDESSNKFIGLDHKVNLGKNGTHVTLKEDNFILGDINNDGKVNMKDYFLLKRNLVENESYYSKNADMNGDGKISIVDAVLLGSKIRSC